MRAAAILIVYLLLAVWYTQPLLQLSHSHIAGGEQPGDPLLNASVLWWTATNVPLTEQWWNAPQYYPSKGVTTFTENLLGISPIATPVYWLTGNPLTAYNVALFLTWPLSAFAAYLLALYLTRRQDAAFIAGLAYGFSTYRAGEVGHLQVVSSYWIPFALLGLHGYLRNRRRPWLVLFGAGWLLQSLANLYLMLFGAVLIGLWLLYFASKPVSGRPPWRTFLAVIVAWAIASIPLIPILLTYRRVHEHYGLERVLTQPIGFSYTLKAWFATSSIVRIWSRILPDDGDNLFPGVTVLAFVIAGAIVLLVRKRPDLPQIRGRRAALIAATWITLVLSVAVILFTMVVGGWEVALGGPTLRVHDLDRAVLVASICSVALVVLTRRMREALGRRSPIVFYGLGALAMAVFALGPVVSARGQIVLEPAPYGLLLALPGFDGLRIPSRFWMLGVLCLATVAGLLFNRLTPADGALRRVLFGALSVGLLLDAWIWDMRMVPVTAHLPVVESPGRPEPILELPIGDGGADAFATFRAMGHRRGVFNGVSGYEPPHYTPLVEGLSRKDPDMLRALASLGSFDVVIDETHDAAPAWAEYFAAVPGMMHVATELKRSTYRIPAEPRDEIRLGEPLPIVRTSAVGGLPGRAADGRLDDAVEARWDDGPQHPKQWFVADLGAVREVGGVTEWLGKFARDFPRHLAIDVSIDGATWETVWEGRTAATAFLAAAQAPRETPLRFSFAPRPARFVRLRQLAESRFVWVIAELAIHAPR